MRVRKDLTIAAVALTAFLTYGCSSTDSEPESEPTPQTQSVAPDFLTVDLLADYLADKGFPCEGVKTVRKGQGRACSDTYAIGIWASPEEAESMAESNASILKGAGIETCFIAIGNGLVAPGDTECEAMSSALTSDGAVIYK